MKIKKDGLIYQLAYVYNQGWFREHEKQETDICTLTRRVLGGLFMVLLITLITSFVSYCVLDSLLALYFWITTGFFEVGLGIATFIVVTGFVALLALFAGASAVSEVGVVRQMIASHRDRYCVKIEIEQ